MIIWSGIGILIPLILAAIFGFSNSMVKAGHLPETGYQITLVLVVSALVVGLVGRLLRKEDGSIPHTLFFINWSVWPAILLAGAALTGWQSYQLESRVTAALLEFEVNNQTEFQRAVKEFEAEKQRLGTLYERPGPPSPMETLHFNAQSKLLEARRLQLIGLARIFGAPSKPAQAPR